MYKKFLLGLSVGLLFAGAVGVFAAPVSTIFRNVLPEANNTYDLGSTTPSARWKNVYTQDLTVSGTCTGCGANLNATSTEPLMASWLVATSTTIYSTLNGGISLPAGAATTPSITGGTPNAAGGIKFQGQGNSVDFLSSGAVRASIGSSVGFKVHADWPLVWVASGAADTGTADVGVNRTAAGVLSVNNGAVGGAGGLISNASSTLYRLNSTYATSTTLQATNYNPAGGSAVFGSGIAVANGGGWESFLQLYSTNYNAISLRNATQQWDIANNTGKLQIYNRTGTRYLFSIDTSNNATFGGGGNTVPSRALSVLGNHGAGTIGVLGILSSANVSTSSVMGRLDFGSNIDGFYDSTARILGVTETSWNTNGAVTDNLSGQLQFQTMADTDGLGNDGAAPTTKMWLTGDGLLGVGTATPVSTLTVYGTSDPYVTIGGADGDTIKVNSNVNTYSMLFSTIGDDQNEIDLNNRMGAFDVIAGGNTVLTVASSSANVGVASTSPWRTLSVSGTAAISGLTTQSGVGNVLCVKTDTFEIVQDDSPVTACSGASTVKIKKDISELDSAQELKNLLLYTPIEYRYKESYSKDQSLHLGFTAEEVAKLDPRLAEYKDGEPSGVKYTEFIPKIISALQELFAKIAGVERRLDDQQKQIDELREEIKNLKQ